MGGGVGRWPMEGGQGGDGGGHQRAVGATKAARSLFWAPLKTYNWSDLARDEGGGMGGGVGGGPWRAGKGGDGGGGTRE